MRAAVVTVALFLAVAGTVGGPVGSAVAAKKPRPIATAPFTPPTDVALADTPPPWALPANARPYVEAAGLTVLGEEQLEVHYHAHLDVIADGAKVTVPAGIGFEVSNGKVTGLTVLHTHDTSGVIHIESAANKPYTLGQVFTEWGVALERRPGRRPPRRRLARAEGLRERSALLRRPRHDQAAAPPRDRTLVRPERPDPQGPKLVPLPGWALDARRTHEEQRQAGDDAHRADHGPHRLAGHERALDHTDALEEPHDRRRGSARRDRAPDPRTPVHDTTSARAAMIAERRVSTSWMLWSSVNT